MDQFTKLTVQYIDQIKEYLSQKLNGSSDLIELDFEQVSDVDISFIQLLVAFQLECNKHSKNLKLSNIPVKLIDGLAISGADQIVQI
ncbi:MAG: STAS domain-containing protein [Campylobacterales bacterium]|nr:STAS domain-containing protein [Campylobacterales bacterium]